MNRMLLAATMEHRTGVCAKKQTNTEITVETEVEEAALSTAYIEVEIDVNHWKLEPGLVQILKSEPVWLVKEDILKDNRQGAPATSTRALVGRTSVSTDNAKRGKLLHINKQLKNTDLDNGLVKHIGSHYKTKIGLNGIKQENAILSLDSRMKNSQVLHSQMRDKTIEDDRNDSSFVLYVCDFCLKTFHNKSGLGSHLKYVHGCKSYGSRISEKNFECQLSRHIRQVHSLKKHIRQTYRCDKCLKVYKSKKYLWDHCKQVHGTESHKCTQCNKEFKCKTYLLNHVRNTHSEEKYECEICRKMSKSRAALHSHVSRFHRNRSADLQPRLPTYSHSSFPKNAVVRSAVIGSSVQHRGPVAVKLELADTELKPSWKLQLGPQHGLQVPAFEGGTAAQLRRQ